MDYNAALYQLLEYAKRLYPHIVPPILWGAPPSSPTATQPQQESVYCTRMKKEDAERYIPANGTRAVIFDQDANVIYMVSTNGGKTSTTILDYQEREQHDPMAELQNQMAVMQNQLGQLTQILAGKKAEEETTT